MYRHLQNNQTVGTAELPDCCGVRRRYASLVALAFAISLLVTATPTTAQEAAQPAGSDAASKAFAGIAADAVAASAIDEKARDEETGLTAEVLDPEIDSAELEHRLVPLTKDELAALAGKWLQIVKRKTEEVMSAQIAIVQTQGAVEDAARERLTGLSSERSALFDKYATVISAWEKKGGSAESIAEYRAYRTAVLVEETRTADVQTLLAQLVGWLVSADGGLKVAMNVGVVVVSLIVLLIVARTFRRLALRLFSRVPNLSKLLQAFLVALVYWIVVAIGLMVVLSALGIDISPVFALIGGASFILAFAFQDTLGNLASGLMIMINRPFDEGDYVDVGGVAGTVKAVSIVATTVTTPDNQVIVIPNKNVWGNVITNVTASDTRRVDLVFGISYEDSIPDAMRVIEETVRAHPLVHAEPEPVIRVHALADSSVNFVCRPWTATSDYWTVYWDLTRRVKEAFDAAGISIPYPQRDVHVKGNSGAVHRTTVLDAGEEQPEPRAPEPRDESEAIAMGEDGLDEQKGEG